MSTASAQRPEDPAQLVVAGARVYTSPTAPARENTTVVVRRGVVSELIAGTPAALPSSDVVVDASGAVVTAGFWNTHVHFTGSRWENAADQDGDVLTAELETMLSRYGFTTVVDTGSSLPNTLALRERIERGDVRGPRIMTTGSGFVTADGTPIYLDTPLPELTTEHDAARAIGQYIEQGADAIKLFTGSVLGGGRVGYLPLPIVRAATREARARQRLVLAHPTSLRGAQTAVAGGVDILVHTTPGAGPWPERFVAQMVANDVGLVPTLTLFRVEAERRGATTARAARYQSVAMGQLGAFARIGGDVLFGTDVGYTAIADPTEEYERMRDAGLSVAHILTALTTAPARRFAPHGGAGVVAVGSPADLVVLDDDPARDVANLAAVRLTVRAGNVVFDADAPRAPKTP